MSANRVSRVEPIITPIFAMFILLSALSKPDSRDACYAFSSRQRRNAINVLMRAFFSARATPLIRRSSSSLWRGEDAPFFFSPAAGGGVIPLLPFPRVGPFFGRPAGSSFGIDHPRILPLERKP